MLKKLLMILLLACGLLHSNAQSITVTAPNGGEVLYSCQQYVIQWNAAGTSNFYDIEFSLNGGATWASVATNLNVTTGQFNWTVPTLTVESSICLVRITDKNNPATQDVSDAFFSIKIPVVVTAPNGGENWRSGLQRTITWNIQGTSLRFNIDYSIDGGTTWTSVVSNYSTSAGTYDWTIPNTPSTNCKVRVRDVVTGCMQDVSDGPFTILPLAPQLTYPNGGNEFGWQTGVTITWNTATFYNNAVRLEYSIDNGVTWVLIAEATTNDGTQNWNTPNVNSTTCLVKVSEAYNLSVFDVSNTTFSILPPALTITAPNGGESLFGCNTTAIQFSQLRATYVSRQVNFFYSADNGATWASIGNATPVTPSGPQTYNWSVPNIVTSNQCLIRGIMSVYAGAADTSDAVFTINYNKPVTITSPNGGESFAPGSSTIISWTNTAQASGLYDIAYSINGGTSFTSVATGVSGNAYNWAAVPNTPSTNCVIRITDNQNSCKADTSDAPFTIRAQTPTMTFPNGGNVFSWGQSITITWNQATYYGASVRTEYSTDNGLTWNVISTSTTNDGSQSWTIPANINSTTCLVKVSDASNLLLNDVSNVTFSILPPAITITAPNGGENLFGCNNYTIQYTLTRTGYISPTVTWSYSADNGATWNVITVSSHAQQTGAQTYIWTIPNIATSNQCLIRAISSGYPSMADTTDAVFTINYNKPITVTSPNGGEVFAPASSQTISWTNTAQASGLYNIAYSINGGSTFTSIATNVSGNSYNWASVPNTPSANCLIRVTDNANSCKGDTSDAPFTIGAQQPTMTFPNGGNVFSWAQPITITWNQATYYGTSVRIEYSTDNGLTWTVISTSTTNDGTQSWTVPSNINSTTCLVKVSDASNLALNDVSNATFSILPPALTITSPNGGENFFGCNVTSFQYTLTRTGYISASILFYYSADNGTTWSVITSVTPAQLTGAQTFIWTLPNIATSNQCLVRAASTAFPSLNDTSDAVFTINNNRPITITSPNGGEVFAPASSQTISWTNTAQASGLYNIAYSTNGGSTFTSIATSVSGNNYTWASVPNTPSANCLIRVTDNATSCKGDTSDAPFTIGAQQPTMTFPNGGNVFSWAQPITITWNQATYYGTTVRLEYSTDNGLTWNAISTSTTNDGTQSWTIPSNINSTTCLVKVSDASNLALTDVSNATFSILPPALTITAPNGGENFLGCNVTTFQYTLTRTGYISPSILFYYSADNGTTWSVITIVTPAQLTGAQTFSWTLPNIATSNQCLVRAASTAFPSLNDTSDAVFTINNNRPITITSPNGGEVFAPASSQTIRWTNTAQASGLYNIAYSINGGSTFTSLATNVSGNSYTWASVPNTPSANCLIRVTDNATSCKGDTSDAPFTIGAQPPVMTFPNGGNVFSWAQPITLTWNQATYYGTSVRLEYSTDNGLTWIVISTSTTNDGSQSWTIPSNINSTDCLVKVSDASNLALSDVSNASFSILPPAVTITAPNGGENFLGCNSTTVQYTLTRTGYISPTVSFSYSTNNGITWTSITGITHTQVTGAQSFVWTLPNIVTSSQCLIRAISSAFPTISDTSDAVFSLVLNTPITVTSPNGGQSLTPGNTQLITWTNTAQASGLYSIAYSTDGGSTFTTIASNISGNAYNWTPVANTPSTNCFIRVSDYNNGCKNDVTDEPFTITALKPLLTYPNGGQSFVSASTVTITWNAATFYSTTVRLEYSLDSGLTWTTIATGTTNDGTQSWILPVANSTKCLVRVSDPNNLTLTDVSDATFSIRPIIQVTNPNGGDELGACTQTSITFNHDAGTTSFDIAYSLNNGSTWNTITTAFTATGTTGTYNWTLPNSPTTQALIRVSPTGLPANGDISDANFIIKPSVTLLQPNFGGTLQAGTVFPIKWSSDGISNLYDLAYSTTGAGGPWINILLAYNTASNTYNWAVPATLSTNCYIRVRDNINSCKQDITNLPFTISNTPQPIAVTSSNGLDTLFSCDNYTIRWTEPGVAIGTYNIDYSINGGVSWINIATNYVTTAGSYAWVVPGTATELGLIRVTAAGSNTVFDVSDAAFVIRSRNVVASNDVLLCSAGQTQLTATGGFGNFVWSPATGLSNSSIANPTATLSATQVYVVSSSNANCTARDTVVVTVTKPIKVVAEVTTPNVCNGAIARFTARVTDAAAGSYQWKKNNVNIGGNDSVLLVSNVLSSDVFTCTVTSSLPCVTSATSAGVSTTAYQSLGNDTSIAAGCIGCTVNLTGLYSASNYPVLGWSTNNPAAVRVGAYTLIGSGSSCRDTAIVYVNANDAGAVRGCAASIFSFTSDVAGAAYQWQQNNGGGWTNLLNNTTVNGVRITGAKARVLTITNGSTALNGNQYRCVVDGANFSTTSTIKVSTFWTGVTSTDWNTASNWSCGKVPDANTDVFIYGGTTNSPIVSITTSCNSVTIKEGGRLTVNTGVILLLTGK